MAQTQCTDTRVIVCKHVQAGHKADVYFGSTTGTEYALCFVCADVIDTLPQEASLALVDAICLHCATAYGVPATLPGPMGWYDCALQLQQPLEGTV